MNLFKTHKQSTSICLSKEEKILHQTILANIQSVDFNNLTFDDKLELTKFTTDLSSLKDGYFIIDVEFRNKQTNYEKSHCYPVIIPNIHNEVVNKIFNYKGVQFGNNNYEKELFYYIGLISTHNPNLMFTLESYSYDDNYDYFDGEEFFLATLPRIKRHFLNGFVLIDQEGKTGVKYGMIEDDIEYKFDDHDPKLLHEIVKNGKNFKDVTF
jgi:hypothetical protein